jgi:hypothetical protein
MSATAQPIVYEAHILHMTAEPVSVRVAMPIPSTTWTKAVVQDWVPTAPVSANIACGTVDNPSTAENCTVGAPTDFPDPTTSGALTTGAWFVLAVDARTQTPVGECTLESATTVRCDLPARRTAAPVTDVALLLGHHANSELKPLAVGEVGEFTLVGNTFTGVNPATTSSVVRCASLVIQLNNQVFCKATTTFRDLVALRQLIMNFGASNLVFATGLDKNRLETPPYIPSGTVAGAPITWNSGVDDLPGTQH